ncbi:hypothetical protein D3C80_2100360 [compost metagenome]
MGAKADPEQLKPFLVVAFSIALQLYRHALLERLQTHFSELEIVFTVHRINVAFLDGHVPVDVATVFLAVADVVDG